MSHFSGQGLVREPFSNSPDPSFLLDTRQHATCLQELEISLRLRRGLNVVTGDIGTGKTTLCRCLLRVFAAEAETDAHLMLDPHFETSEEFLRVILSSVSGQPADPALNLWQLKETLKQQLFRLGMVEKRLVILVIDEGQKISPENLEILREMLNYETNTAKLLQIVIFGQRELEPVLDAMPNLADRVNVRRRLSPLNLAETRRMIRHRLAVAAGEGRAPGLDFTSCAAMAVHLASGGSPRRSVRLCHRAMLEMLLRGKTRAGLFEVLAAVRAEGKGRPPRSRRALTGLAVAGLAALLLACGGLWLGLGSRGPVLGSVPAGQEQPVRTAPALREQAATGLSAAGLTLRPGSAGEADGADGERAAAVLGANAGAQADVEEERGAPVSRLTLLPPRDQGPTLRQPVGEGRPPLLNVSLPEAKTVAARLARQAVYEPEGR